MKKIILMLVLLLVTLVGCGGTPLAANFDEEEVREVAKQVVEEVMVDDYESVWSRFGVDMVAALPTVASFEEAIGEIIDDAGALEEVSVVTINGEVVDDMDIAQVVVRARNDNNNLLFTMSFNDEMELIGFFVR